MVFTQRRYGGKFDADETDLLDDAFDIFEGVQSGLRSNLENVRRRIADAARVAGRDPGDIKLVAVSKTHPVDVLNHAIEAGASVFGENKVQEAESKIAEIGGERVEWHLIGHLQSNKARKAVRLFDVIHSVDSVDLAERLERLCIEEDRVTLPVLIQVDLAGEESKSGVPETDLQELVDLIRSCTRLRLDGLMVLPPFFDEAEKSRPFFKRLREIRDDLSGKGVFADRRGELSMGMSHDFEIAIGEGATIVRVGTAIFGSRSQTK